MNTMRLCGTMAFALACLMAGPIAGAQSYPTKAVKIEVGNPPGGTVDTIARVLGEELQKMLGQPFLVENRPGANGNIAVEYMLQAPADGYTILLAAPGPFVTHGALYKNLRFDPKTAFAPVSLVATAPLVLVVANKIPAKTLKEFIDYMKANPGKVTFASQGNGSMAHLAMEMFKDSVGVEAIHAPYRGSAPAMTDLLGGNVDAMFDNTTTSLPYVKSGGVRALAVAEKSRISAAPNIPTLDESGVKGFEATPWFGLAVPAATPKAVVTRLGDAVREVLRQPAVEAKFTAAGIQVRASTAEEFSAVLRADTTKWERVIKASGVTID